MLGKVISLALLGQLAICGIAKADGADSPQFPFAAADAAFQAAAIPTAAQLGSPWYLIGIAENPDIDQDIVGYWANGEFQMSGYSGYFYQQVTITNSTDAFGNPSVTWDEKRYGAETGDLYGEYIATGAFASTGLALGFPAIANGECASSLQCRLVTAQSMLLCRMIENDTRPECRQDSANGTQVTYMAYKQFTTAP